MITSSLTENIDNLIQRAHGLWLLSACSIIDKAPEAIDAESLIGAMPATNNGDMAYCLASVIRQAEGLISWNALSASIEISLTILNRWQQDHYVELLWSGPSPSSQIPARRIDQALYDLIGSAKEEILLVTFAARSITRLAQVLTQAIERGVQVRLILEFEQESEGQLSMDALSAFPATIREKAQVYYWPIGKRERNPRGRPGKLHAKVAVVDDQANFSSANLTDDAFNRNFELGSLFAGYEVVSHLKAHFEGLCANGTFVLLK